MAERYCIVTGEKIEECFGYVLARDFIDYKPGKPIREISGKGMLILDLLEMNGISRFGFLEGLVE